MSKKLNIQSITNELELSAFFPSKHQSPTPIPEKPLVQEEQPNPPDPDRPTKRPPDEALSRRSDRPTGKGVLVRRGFEWREDQLRALKQRSLHDQLEGKHGSMSQMVRDALDDYLQKRATGT